LITNNTLLFYPCDHPNPAIIVTHLTLFMLLTTVGDRAISILDKSVEIVDSLTRNRLAKLCLKNKLDP